MRLCLVSGYPPRIGRGAETTWLLAEELAKYSEVQELFILANGDTQGEERRGKLRILRVWREGSWATPFAILSKILGLKPDVVHIVYSYLFYGPPAHSFFFTLCLFPLLRVNRIKTVVTIHQVFPLAAINRNFQETFSARMPPVFIKSGFYVLNKIISLCSNSVITLHRRHQEILSRDYGVRNTRYLSIGLKEIRFLSQEAAKEKQGLQGRFLLLFFGFIAPFKGIEHALEAVKLLKDTIGNVFLIIAGSILPSLRNDPKTLDYVRRLKESISRNNLEGCVAFKERYISEEEAALLFSSADVVLVPYQEQSGPSEIFKKAFLYKIPVVASDIDYLKEDIKDGVTGILVPKDDPAKLSAAILRLYRDSRLCDLLRNNIAQAAGEYDIRNTARAHLELYRDIYARD